MWHNVKNLPPLSNDDTCHLRSSNVLFTDGKTIYHGYVAVDDDGTPTWKMFGRDGYTVHNVIEWIDLPQHHTAK